MTTFGAVRRAMMAREPMIGRQFPLAGAAAQTVTVTQLATGTVGARVYSEKYLLRPDAALSLGAAVDRLRISSDYDSTTGVITHGGAAYTDLTATSETLEIHEFDPYRVETAIQEALGATVRVDESVLQGRSDGRYTFGALAWLSQPSDVALIGVRGSPVLTGNRLFAQWGTVSTSGMLQPDRWALGGSGATFARDSLSRSGLYSLKVTRSGANTTVGQTAQAVTSGNDTTTLRGGTVTGVVVGMTTDASSLRVRVTSEKADGTVLSTTNSSYHTGSGAWEEVSAEHAVDDAADVIRVVSVQEVDGDVYLDEGYASVGEIGDGERSDRYHSDWWRGHKDWSQNPLTLHADGRENAQIVVRSLRPYPTFDADRVAAGLADADLTDCPLDLCKYRALSRFFDGLARDQEGNANLLAKANEYALMADNIASAHIADLMTTHPGMQTYSGVSYGRIATAR